MRGKTVVYATLLACTCSLPGHATGYLDPSMGSIALQVAAGGLLAVAVTLSWYWRWLLGLFGRKAPAPFDEAGPGAAHGPAQRPAHD